jgi:hypothetical protein
MRLQTMATYTGKITTTRLGKSNGREVLIIDFRKTPSKPFEAASLKGIIEAIAAFAKELEAEPEAYKTSVSLARGVRAPAGFNALNAQYSGELSLNINAHLAPEW